MSLNIKQAPLTQEEEEYWYKQRIFRALYRKLEKIGLADFDSNGNVPGDEGELLDGIVILQTLNDFFEEKEEYLKCHFISELIKELSNRRQSNIYAEKK